MYKHITIEILNTFKSKFLSILKVLILHVWFLAILVFVNLTVICIVIYLKILNSLIVNFIMI
jgi:hypothetical protein